MDQGLKPKRQIHPKETANLLSLLSFFYTADLFKKGYKKDLEEEDLYEVLTSCRSKKLGDQLELQWEIDKKKTKKPSLLRVLWTCFGKTYLLFGLMQLIMRTILVLSIPEALGKLVSYFTPGQTNLTKEDAYCYAAVVVGLNIVNHIYTQNYMIAITEFGIRVRTAICSFIYRKTLKMTEASLSEITMGKIVTLITKDVFAVEMVILFANDIWIGVLQTALICFLIYNKIGLAAFTGVGFFLVLLPVQVLIGRMAASLRLKTSKKTDERIQLTQEILSIIKTIKMYAWENFFKEKISKARKKEVTAIFKLFYLKIIIIVIGGLSAKIGFYLLIMTHVWLGNYVTAEIVYFVKGCFGKLRHLLSIMLPLGITFGAEFSATLIRLKTLLEAEEVPTSANSIEVISKEPSISLKAVTVRVKDVEIFKDISIDIQKGLNIVTGHIGSGKTTFLKTILGNYRTEGNLTIYGKISYASQEPWLFPASIKSNILFGEKFDQDRYRQILEICALNKDLKSFGDNDDTIVGDNGMNLSKGQQARVNLARALYRQADIYLLDDCLAALDGHVGDYIFKECILKFLKNKLCIFVTNNYDHMQRGSRVIEVEHGNVKYSDNLKNEKFEDIKTRKMSHTDYIEEIDKEPKPDRIYSETQKHGKVDISTYKKYLMFGGGYFVVSLILVMFVVVQSIVSYSDKLVSNWVTLEQNLSSYKMNNLTSTSEFVEKEEKRTSLLNLYTIIIVSSTFLSLLKSVTFFAFNRKASINLHKATITKIIYAKMKFFDTHFIGNILNRFSKDLCTIDEHLPFVMNECFELTFILMGILFLVGSVNPMFLIPAAIFFIIAYLFRHVYLRTGRSLQRLEASTRSPLLGHLNASFEGLTTIRAFKAQEIIKDEFDRHQDLYTSVNYTLHSSKRALAFILDGLCSLFITIVIVRFLAMPIGKLLSLVKGVQLKKSFVLEEDRIIAWCPIEKGLDDFFKLNSFHIYCLMVQLLDTSVGDVGMAITQSFHLTGLLQYGIRIWADFENQMTSVERVLQYTEVEQEKQDGKVVKSWPQEGKITYDNVTMNYDEKRQVLKNLSFTIKPVQKVGIVGRTGAGKSSIISTLFRLYDIEGTIKIDEEDIQDLSLSCLRNNMAIIPQDPILISGTVRENVDPLKKLEDEEIWKIIKIAKLENAIHSLSDRVDGNANLSAGQKQLLSLARAIARKNKIVVLDEATANLDTETDSLIRGVIEENFSNCTVIIIAHRLASVLSADIVMVIDEGQIVEQDAPSNLMQNKNSLFFEMIKQT